MKLEESKRYWEQSGETFPCDDSVTPTTRDPYLGHLERQNVLDYLGEEYTCLEVGCGDASHTMHYARKVKKMMAVDVADSLINLARERLQRERVDNVDLHVGSVLDTAEMFTNSRSDCVISQRCLINLPDWTRQRDAITQIHHVLADDGVFLMTEGFQDNLDYLNSARTALSLPEIRVVDYNRNFVRDDFERFVSKLFDIIEMRHYGAYLFFSRIYHPLVVSPEEPRHDSKMNEVAMRISQVLAMPDLEKYSYNLFYVLRKRKV